MQPHPELHPRDIYRLPWSLTDNVLSWLEPTKRCNLSCEGCYSRNDPTSDKTLEQIRADLDAFVSQRRTDSISIAGGDPLMHPEIVEVVRLIRHTYGLKPVVNTNGLALTRELLLALRDAGLHGFTFHVDSRQGRPGWKDADELELNNLRLHYARMVREAGDLSVAFNCTVYPDTLEHVPGLLAWAADNIADVNAMVFILYRTLRSSEFEYFAHGERIAPEVVYRDQDQLPKPLSAHDVLNEIWKVDPEFRPSAYLGGTKDPNAFKWLLTGRLGARGTIYGHVGPRYMELVQTAHHAVTGRWLGYVQPSLLAHGRSMLAGFSPFDDGVRKAARGWLRRPRRAPRGLGQRLHFQSVLIIQPIDMMPDGEQSMCDGCPDMTVLDGQLVWSCRLDEKVRYGCFLSSAPRSASEQADVGFPPREGEPMTPPRKQPRRRVSAGEL